ncbi:hypothetical protein COEREDRAFT_9208 [Coemansia reversa NRRL 1564]|uniref:Uncharacterized protein n=1 Tax=Coemansia reversa (strain ATCC 12441 / NRRL 1564) TaxID=763665 RepID=A0A2G5B945_COERN|nr:hypothetical protein COEREDRAFT_9208 [Coemansia reversa NRRL 1564]|eukprot:PIA15502.1 hypothetical protein COEREDRAFT_9208 [Coemansia reversa NRRL 1564]
MQQRKRRKQCQRVNNSRRTRWFKPGELVTVKRTGMPIPVAVQPYHRLGPFKVMHRENTVYYLSDMQNQRLAHGILGDILLPYTLAEESGNAAAKDSADSLDEFNNGSSSGLSSPSTSSGGSSLTAGPSHFAGRLSSSTPYSKMPEYWPDGNTSNNGRDDNETGYLSSGSSEMGRAVLADNPERAVLLPELTPMPYIEQSLEAIPDNEPEQYQVPWDDVHMAPANDDDEEIWPSNEPTRVMS